MIYLVSPVGRIAAVSVEKYSRMPAPCLIGVRAYLSLSAACIAANFVLRRRRSAS